MRTTVKSLGAILTTSLMLFSCASSKCPEVTIWGVPAYEKVDIQTEVAHYKNVTMPVKVKVSPDNIEGQEVHVSCSKGEFPTVILHKRSNPLVIPVPSAFVAMMANLILATDRQNLVDPTSYYVDPTYFSIEAPDSMNLIQSGAMKIDALFQ